MSWLTSKGRDRDAIRNNPTSGTTRSLRTALALGCCLGVASQHLAQAERLVIGPVPSDVRAGEAFPVVIQVVDDTGELLTNHTATLRLQAFMPLREWPVISEVDFWGQVVEIANPGRDGLDLSGWELLVGRDHGGASLASHARLRLPPATLLGPGAVLTWSGTGTPPGLFPSLVSATPFNLPGQPFHAVRLLDAAGLARDEVYFEPAGLLPSLTLWHGSGLPAIPSTNTVHSRVGDANRFRSGDWVTNLPPSLGAVNPGLELPWQNRRHWSLPSPSAVILSNGVWSGSVSLPEPGEDVVLVADTGNGVQTQGARLRVHPLPPLVLEVPDAMRTADEANPGGLGDVILSLPAPTATDLTVTLDWDAPDEFTSPPTLVLPAGTTSMSFGVTNLDDLRPDGLAQVRLTASGPAYTPAAATFWNADNEVGRLHLTLPVSLLEGQGWSAEPGRVWLETPAPHDVLVRLTAGAPLEVPSQVIIPAGRSSAAFAIYVIEDAWANPVPWAAPVTARTAPWPETTAFQALVDNEDRWVTVEAPAEIVEGTPVEAVLKLRAARTHPIPVRVDSPDAVHRERLGLPIEIVVPAGVTEQAFTLVANENGSPDPERNIELYLDWEGQRHNTGVLVRVLDDDSALVGIEVAYDPSAAVLAGRPFPVSARLVASSGATYRANLSGQLDLAAAPDSARLAPGTDGIQFVNGVWEGEVTIQGEALGVLLRVTASEHSGEGPALDVLRGWEHRLAFTDVQWWATGERFLVIENAHPTTARLIELDPLTGIRGRSLDLPIRATRLALAEDGTAAWLTAPRNVLLAINLTNWSIEGVFPLVPDEPEARAHALLVLPGDADHVVAVVDLDPWGTGLRLQLHKNGALQPDTVPLEGPSLNVVLVAGRHPEEVFGHIWGTIYRFEVADTGVRLGRAHWFNVTASLDLADGWLIGGNGETASADTLEVGERFPAPVGELACLTPGQPWIAFHDNALTFSHRLTREEIAAHAAPHLGGAGPVPSPSRLFPWGRRGLALVYPDLGVIHAFESPVLGQGGGVLAGRRPTVLADDVPTEDPFAAALNPSAPNRGSLAGDAGGLPRTDLGVLSVSVPQHVIVGQEFRVSGVLTNAGPDDLVGIRLGFFGAPDEEFVPTGCETCTSSSDGGWVVGSLAAGQTLPFTVRFQARLPGLHVVAIYPHIERQDPNAVNDYIGTAFVAALESPPGDGPGVRLPKPARFEWDPLSRLILATFDGVLSGVVALDPETLEVAHRVSLSGDVSNLAVCRDGQHAWLFGSSGFTRVNYRTGAADLGFAPELPWGLWDMASPPGQPDLLLVIAGDGRARLYDQGSLRPVAYGPLNFPAQVWFTADGRLFASANQQLRELRLTPDGLAEARNLDTIAGWGGASYTDAAGRLFARDGRVIEIATGGMLTASGPVTADPETGLAYRFLTGGAPLVVQSYGAHDLEPVWQATLAADGLVLTLGAEGLFARLGDFYRTFALPELDAREPDLRLSVSLPATASGVAYDLPLGLALTNRSAFAAPATRIEVTLSSGLVFAPGQPDAGGSRTVIELGSVVAGTNLTRWLLPLAVGQHEVRVVVSSGLPDATPEEDDQRHVVTVPDDPLLLVDDLVVAEGGIRGGSPLTAWLSRPAPSGIVVPFTIHPGTAQAEDFVSPNGTFVFAPGDQVATASAVRDDNSPEFDETATLELTPSPGMLVARTTVPLTLRNDDWPEVRLADLVIREPVTGQTNATLHFTLSGPAPFPVEAWFRALPGSASPAADYLPREGWLVFPPGTTLRVVALPVLADEEREPDETVQLSLVEVRNGVPGIATATLTILNRVLLPQPVVTLRTLTTAELAVEYPTLTGVTYQVQHTTNLTTGQWRDLGSPTPGTGRPALDRLRATDLPESYFRVVAQ